MCISMRRSCWVHPLQYLAFHNMEMQQNKWAEESLEKFEIIDVCPAELVDLVGELREVWTG